MPQPLWSPARDYSCALVRTLNVRTVLKTFAAALAGLTAACGGASLAAPVNAGHLTAELVAQDTAVAPGGTVWVALRQQIEPGWHTYWRNPGDSGLATSVSWVLPKGVTAGELQWPTPG